VIGNVSRGLREAGEGFKIVFLISQEIKKIIGLFYKSSQIELWLILGWLLHARLFGHVISWNWQNGRLYQLT
jgi:hypothetical protein